MKSWKVDGKHLAVHDSGNEVWIEVCGFLHRFSYREAFDFAKIIERAASAVERRMGDNRPIPCGVIDTTGMVIPER